VKKHDFAWLVFYLHYVVFNYYSGGVLFPEDIQEEEDRLIRHRFLLVLLERCVYIFTLLISKSEYRNSKQYRNYNVQNSKHLYANKNKIIGFLWVFNIGI